MDARSHNATDEEKIVASIFAQLDQHDLFTLPHDEQLKQKNKIATNLVHQTQKLEHHVALNILIQATRHRLFSHEQAHKIIINGIRKENYHRSPLNLSVKTLAFVKKYQAAYPNEVEEFLSSPEQLLIWINQASSLEVARLLEYYFPCGTEHYSHIRNLAENEFNQDSPGKAYICYALMYAGTLERVSAGRLQTALDTLQSTEPNKFNRVILSAALRVSPSNDAIKNASGCFVNLNNSQITNSNLEKTELDGSLLNGANLDHSNLQYTSMNQAQLNNASLKSANLNYATLIRAHMHNANLCDSVLTNAKLHGADLSGANLSHANLCRADLTETNLAGAKLTGCIFFYDVIFNMISSFKFELDSLAKMIEQHRFYFELQHAILHSFIKQANSKAIPEHLIISIFETAYEHPIFSQHHQNTNLKTASNLITSTIFGWLDKPAVDEILNVPTYETAAQERLREELNKRISIRKTQHRPAPPATSPLPPGIKH